MRQMAKCCYLGERACLSLANEQVRKLVQLGYLVPEKPFRFQGREVVLVIPTEKQLKEHCENSPGGCPAYR